MTTIRCDAMIIVSMNFQPFFLLLQMRLLILPALFVGLVSCVNVPTSSHSFVTYHGANHHATVNHHQPSPHQSYSRPSSTYYGSIFTQPHGYFAATPSKVPSQMCPAMPPPCVKSRYRTLDGSCNNMEHPMWGSANNRYGRLLTPRYGDGISSPTTSVTGQDLPSSRLVSLVIFGEADVPDPQFTLANMQWGQIMTHDMSMQAGGTQSRR